MKIVTMFVRSVTEPIWVLVLCGTYLMVLVLSFLQHITLFLHIQDPMQKLHLFNARGAFLLTYKQQHTQCNYKDQVIVFCLDGWLEK